EFAEPPEFGHGAGRSRISTRCEHNSARESERLTERPGPEIPNGVAVDHLDGHRDVLRRIRQSRRHDFDLIAKRRLIGLLLGSQLGGEECDCRGDKKHVDWVGHRNVGAYQWAPGTTSGSNSGVFSTSLPREFAAYEVRRFAGRAGVPA